MMSRAAAAAACLAVFLLLGCATVNARELKNLNGLEKFSGKAKDAIAVQASVGSAIASMITAALQAAALKQAPAPITVTMPTPAAPPPVDWMTQALANPSAMGVITDGGTTIKNPVNIYTPYQEFKFDKDKGKNQPQVMSVPLVPAGSKHDLHKLAEAAMKALPVLLG